MVASEEMEIISAAETSPRQNTSTDSTGNEELFSVDDVSEEKEICSDELGGSGT